MAEDNKVSNDLVTELTAAIVGAYVTKNPVPVSDLPGVIASVADSIGRLGQTQAEVVPEPQKPAISIRKSLTHDYLISLEDGQQYRTLKRHLGKLGLTPEEYRAKWGLPVDYPMVAPAYAAKRSELAKKLGLGRKPGTKRGRGKAKG
ncbi:MucR family transcriptional regulator [Mesorhizobium sp. Pch-S]|jgi:predicted transcriptional regulator|uniref:MucR family transcriptional regulator n=1 Tax=Mesorhizobium sp. Pch-S TaxID=2082387 RepID=UPI001012825B|nr:MucR family transcriptional regulator [Mesorhizobium sp. Pch-S]QAZ47043.1 MucR family transcriptional regulator [Mesorhizobium sp. Pch-S]